MSEEYKHIVRLLGKDLDGSRKVVNAISRIKGINIRLANAIVKKADISQEKRLGFLSDVEVKRLGDALSNIEANNLPSWLLNRRKASETGKDTHLTTSDLELQVKQDIDALTSMKAWRGYRHAYGLKVRGQRTRTSGRKGKVIGGIRRKKEQ
jgi:small subunit ribosomal protein S13